MIEYGYYGQPIQAEFRRTPICNVAVYYTSCFYVRWHTGVARLGAGDIRRVYGDFTDQKTSKQLAVTRNHYFSLILAITKANYGS